ncbi:hypothetical protein FA95DRAFT_82715 [Auriscalpium vulgare]|uniref:Uncharacterized protein n=1 Tax=Auriscalpium vulgare TaxID=40419 RepID=A0ACB8RNU6_9AGAM|nr:hypothetical protein FA95DRAFT_82715 [Auriscalpium vulgare]
MPCPLTTDAPCDYVVTVTVQNRAPRSPFKFLPARSSRQKRAQLERGAVRHSSLSYALVYSTPPVSRLLVGPPAAAPGFSHCLELPAHPFLSRRAGPVPTSHGRFLCLSAHSSRPRVAELRASARFHFCDALPAGSPRASFMTEPGHTDCSAQRARPSSSTACLPTRGRASSELGGENVAGARQVPAPDSCWSAPGYAATPSSQARPSRVKGTSTHFPPATLGATLCRTPSSAAPPVASAYRWTQHADELTKRSHHGFASTSRRQPCPTLGRQWTS